MNIEYGGEGYWSAPYVTGKSYYMRWAGGLDFEKLKI